MCVVPAFAMLLADVLWMECVQREDITQAHRKALRAALLLHCEEISNRIYRPLVLRHARVIMEETWALLDIGGDDAAATIPEPPLVAPPPEGPVRRLTRARFGFLQLPTPQMLAMEPEWPEDKRFRQQVSWMRDWPASAFDVPPPLQARLDAAVAKNKFPRHVLDATTKWLQGLSPSCPLCGPLFRAKGGVVLEHGALERRMVLQFGRPLLTAEKSAIKRYVREHHRQCHPDTPAATPAPERPSGTFLAKCRQRCAAMVQTATLSSMCEALLSTINAIAEELEEDVGADLLLPVVLHTLVHAPFPCGFLRWLSVLKACLGDVGDFHDFAEPAFQQHDATVHAGDDPSSSAMPFAQNTSMLDYYICTFEAAALWILSQRHGHMPSAAET